VDVEVVVRIEPTEAFEPAQDRFASMPLAAKRMIPGKDVMDVIRELIDERRPLVKAQLPEDSGGASPDDRVVKDRASSCSTRRNGRLLCRRAGRDLGSGVVLGAAGVSEHPLLPDL
jgi:hypothetical protein